MVAAAFIDFLSSEKHFSPHTVTAYKNDLAQFFNYTSSIYGLENPADIDHQVVRSWLAYLIQSGMSARTANRKLSTLKSYFRFLLKTGSVSENPMQKVISPKASQRLPAFIEKDKMNKLFELIAVTSGFEDMRNRLILELLYATGMRVSELIALKHKHVDVKEMMLLVTGKRNKQRVIPFGLIIQDLIKEYTEVKHQQWDPAGPEDYFIVTIKGKIAYPKLIYNTVTQYLSLVTTQTRKSPHTIRHSFATGMLNNGADLNAIKELLGHASLSATQVYTHNSIDRIKHIYQQAHPKA
jgi:integrase/recombinase XerC